MVSHNSEDMFDVYFDASYKHGNILTEEQYEIACDSFESVYGKVLPENKNAAILDIGCGCGQFLYFLKKKGYEDFYGIDISPQQVEFCKRNVSNNVQRADGSEFLKNREENYDVITLYDVLEHFSKKEAVPFLRLVHGSLRDGGTAILRVPNMSNPFSLDSRYRDATHETGFTEKSLYQTLWVAGFRDIQIASSTIRVRSLRNAIRQIMVDIVHKLMRLLYYIQDFAVPDNLGKNLIAICRKQQTR